MTKAHKNIENKYKRLDKYSKINTRNNYSNATINDMTNNNNKANYIPKYIDNININDISKNNSNDIIKKKNRTINLNNSLENNNIDSLGKKFNLSNSIQISN